uniref:Uncharacterized protein LOC105851556 n=1 Tax=Cicer arietinum TaxID=3827 RepID=A0A1S3DXC3_CICAR|nr:uncharacterized protein LOC105851556 [Cicer arietinum]
MIKLSEECSTIVLKKWPPKLKDSGSWVYKNPNRLTFLYSLLTDMEDVLVKVDKFIFPAHFVVLDMEEDKEVSIILGRPFLATGKNSIDVQQGKLTLRLGDEEIEFKVFHYFKNPSSFASYSFIKANDINDKVKHDNFENFRMHDRLEKHLILHDPNIIVGDEIIILPSPETHSPHRK